MIHIDENRIYDEILKRKPKAVALNAPDGLLAHLEPIASQIRDWFGIDTFVLGDPSYGSCDTPNIEAAALGAEIAFHVGHNIALDRLGERTVLIDAWDDVSFEQVLHLVLPILRRFEKIGLCSLSPHLQELEGARKFLQQNGIEVIIGKGKGQLKDGQVFGCEFYPVFETRELVNAFAIMGQSRFHALGVALSTGKPTYMLDPYLNEVVDISELAEERLKKTILGIYRARDAQTFGVIAGLKEGQKMVGRSLDIKTKLEKRGKKVRLLAMREITGDRLALFSDVDAFIQTACPRISIDGYTFQKPVLSVPQAEALMEVLDGREPRDFLQKSHWL